MMMVLSGMSSMEQMKDNLSYMKDFQPLNETELEAVKKVQSIFRGMNLIPCTACRYCHMACPYGAPQYNAEKGHMTKCDGCYSRVAEGKQPICVESCPLRALEFGPIEELRQKHGTLAAVAPLPRAHFTKPNIVIKPNANSRPTGDTTGYLANPEEV